MIGSFLKTAITSVWKALVFIGCRFMKYWNTLFLIILPCLLKNARHMKKVPVSDCPLLLNSIYGINTTCSSTIISKIGIDMKLFKTTEHICSSSGFCPGNHESDGKWNTYLSACYWRINQNKGVKKPLSSLVENFLLSFTLC